MLGQPASWQTVCSPSLLTRLCICRYSGPIFARVLIHSGLRSMGVWLFRTSRRNILRPSGATADTSGSLPLRFYGVHQGTPVDSHVFTCWATPCDRGAFPYREARAGEQQVSH